MKQLKHLFALMCVIACAITVRAQVSPVQAQKLESLLALKVSPVSGGTLQIPTITWGGDMAAVMALHRNYFQEEGLAVKLVHEDDFAKQAQGVLQGNSPFLRGSLDQVMGAASAFKKAGLDLIVLHQYTFSAGGDVLVVREGIKNIADLRGKKIAIQTWGPHINYAATVLEDAGLKPSDFTFVYFKELTVPKADTGGKIIDPVSAFQADASIAAVFCISPDAATLTSGGKIGSGTEGSVKGAKIILSTKTASQVIVDVLAVRKDWFDGNNNKAFGVVHALHRGQEALEALVKSKGAELQQVLAKGAESFLGTATATADIEGMITDCRFVGLSGNNQFFNSLGTTRNLPTMSLEIGHRLSAMGLISAMVVPQGAQWDYGKLAVGLKDNGGNLASTRINTTAVAQVFEAKIAAEAETFSADGTLFALEIHFKPNQEVFGFTEYGKDFEAALKLSQNYAGAVLLIEGHGDTKRLNDLRAQGKSETEIALVEQALRNVSMKRAEAVKAAYIAYCQSKGINTASSAIVAVGMGVKTPKVAVPKSDLDMAANRRVEFKIKNIEAEAGLFKE